MKSSLATVVALIGLTLAPTTGSHAREDRQEAGDILSRVEGRWSGEGTVLGQPSRIEMEWSWTLGRRFLRLTFTNEMGTAPKTTTFEGHAYYRSLGGGQYRGMWFDNSGQMRPISARRDGEALVSNWGTPDTEEGETTYRLAGAGRLEVVDRVKSKDGMWRTFGQSALTKR
ncbi:MAG: hypothetical protein ACRD2N_17220 [Vicinamibacterales bacterium]